MKIDTAPLEGVASQDTEISRAEREHRLWMRGYPRNPSPRTRIWTKSEAIEYLKETNDLHKIATLQRCKSMRADYLEERMRSIGWKGFFIIDDPQPGDFL